MSAADSNTSLPEKKSGNTFVHNETLLLISLYQKCEVFFSDVSHKKKAIWQMIADDMKKNGYSPSGINCENRWKCLTSSSFVCPSANIHIFAMLHIFAYTHKIHIFAMFTRARTAHLDGRFFYADNPNYS